MYNKPFLKVPLEHTDSFLNRTDKEEYKDKIVFLEGTGEIMHDNKLYGVHDNYVLDISQYSSLDDFANIINAIENNKTIIIVDEGIRRIGTLCSKSDIEAKLSVTYQDESLNTNIRIYCLFADGSFTTTDRKYSVDTTGNGIKFLNDQGNFVNIDLAFLRFTSSNMLKFYCIEPVTVIIDGDETVYEANSSVSVTLMNNQAFEIVPTSDNSIISLDAWPGALGTFYSWLEGVQIFTNIVFDMNDLAMYEKWNQGHQGQYHVQYAQYKNCIFWSDNGYVSAVAERTNYTLYYTSELPLCYSTIPDNTFKAFYLAYNVTLDPNWSNPVYRESFSKATWATQVFSYYGLHSIGMFDMDSSDFNIVLPKDCRGLMFYAPNVLNAGVFDATNVTNFGAKSGSWRDAFAYCYTLKNLYIKNLKVNINVSWSPLNQESLAFILDNAANTNKITISLSPYTYYMLTDTNKQLAASKNITLELIATNMFEDNRLNKIKIDGDGTTFLSNDGTYKGIDTLLENSIGDYFFIVETEYINGAYHLKDITFDEITEKFSNGGNMVCHVDGTDYIPLLSVTTNKIIFSGIYNTTSVSLVFDTDGTGTLTSTYLGTSNQINSAKTDAVNESKTYTDTTITEIESNVNSNTDEISSLKEQVQQIESTNGTLQLRAYLFDLGGTYTKEEFETQLSVSLEVLVANMHLGNALTIFSRDDVSANISFVIESNYTLTEDGTLNTLTLYWHQYELWCTLNASLNSDGTYTISLNKV